MLLCYLNASVCCKTEEVAAENATTQQVSPSDEKSCVLSNSSSYLSTPGRILKTGISDCK